MGLYEVGFLIVMVLLVVVVVGTAAGIWWPWND